MPLWRLLLVVGTASVAVQFYPLDPLRPLLDPLLDPLKTNRSKRMVGDNTKEVSAEDRGKKYPYIVGIHSTLDDGKDGSETVICAGTILSLHIIITSAQCVLNPFEIKVFLENFNPYSNDGVIIVKLQLDDESTEMPNPIYYGQRVLQNYSWLNEYTTPFGRTRANVKHNLALLYFEDPLPVKSNFSFPEVDGNSRIFKNPNNTANTKAEMFGWCHPHNKSSEEKGNPKLMKADIASLRSCPTDRALYFFLCANETDLVTCKGDEGGPVFFSDLSQRTPPMPTLPPPVVNATGNGTLNGTTGSSNTTARGIDGKNATTAKGAKPTTIAPTSAPDAKEGTTEQGKNPDTGKDTSKNTNSSSSTNSSSKALEPGPMLSAIVSTVTGRSRKLTYLWPYRYWIASVLQMADMTTIGTVTCPTTPQNSTKGKRTSTAIPMTRPENYYDTGDYNALLRFPYTCGAISTLKGYWAKHLLVVSVAVIVNPPCLLNWPDIAKQINK